MTPQVGVRRSLDKPAPSVPSLCAESAEVLRRLPPPPPPPPPPLSWSAGASTGVADASAVEDSRRTPGPSFLAGGEASSDSVRRREAGTAVVGAPAPAVDAAAVAVATDPLSTFEDPLVEEPSSANRFSAPERDAPSLPSSSSSSSVLPPAANVKASDSLLAVLNVSEPEPVKRGERGVRGLLPIRPDVPPPFAAGVPPVTAPAVSATATTTAAPELRRGAVVLTPSAAKAAGRRIPSSCIAPDMRMEGAATAASPSALPVPPPKGSKACAVAAAETEVVSGVRGVPIRVSVAAAPPRL